MGTQDCQCKQAPCNCGDSKTGSDAKKGITNTKKIMYAVGIALGVYGLLHLSGIMKRS